MFSHPAGVFRAKMGQKVEGVKGKWKESNSCLQEKVAFSILRWGHLGIFYIWFMYTILISYCIDGSEGKKRVTYTFLK